MKKLLLTALASLAIASASAEDATKTFCVGEFENPGKKEADCGDHSWWQRYPYQWYTIYCGGQFIYQPEYLQQLADDNAQITEIAFKYGDEGVVQAVEADLHLYIQNTDIIEFEKKPETDIYFWAAFDPDAPHCYIDYYAEIYYGMDDEIHYVLDKPLAYNGKSILITTWSDRKSEEDPGSGTAYVSYSCPTDNPTCMVYGSDREQFLDIYDTGEQYSYQPPQNIMPVIKFTYTAGTDCITSVASDTESAPEYFNLQGIRIDRPSAPGIYIRRQGNSTTKIIR